MIATKKTRHGSTGIPFRLLIAVMIGIAILVMGIGAYLKLQEQPKTGAERRMTAYVNLKMKCSLWIQAIRQCKTTGADTEMCDCDDCKDDFVEGVFDQYEIPYWLHQMEIERSLYYISGEEVVASPSLNIDQAEWDQMPDEQKANFMSLHTKKCMDGTHFLLGNPQSTNWADAGNEMKTNVKKNREELRMQFAPECAHVCLWINRRESGCQFGIVSCEGPPDFLSPFSAATKLP